MRSLLFLCFLFFSVALALEVQTNADPELTKPLIVDPNALTAAEAENVASVAQVLANEPEAAKVDPPAADEDALAEGLIQTPGATTAEATAGETGTGSAEGEEGGEEGSANPAEEASAIEKEIKLLNSLVEHGKAIAKALPEKEARLKELSAKLAAANGQQQAAGAAAQLAEQKLLLAQIQLKITALKKKLEDLETTETKLKASIEKVESAVQTNDEVNHELNQEAAVASVGTETAAAGATEAAPAAFLSKSVEAITRQAKKLLKGDSSPMKRFKNLFTRR